MNILMINYEFPPVGGGGANANRYLLKEFAKRKDLKIDLVTSSDTCRDYIYDFSENIKIHRLDVRKKKVHYWSQREVLEFLYRSSRYVNQLVKKESYDLSHAFFGFPSGYTTYMHRNEIPYIVSLRGSDVPGFNKRFLLQYVLLRPLLKRIWKGAASIIANSMELKALALETAPDVPVNIIYNGIDADEFKPVQREERDRITILCIARLIPRKGIDYLIRALPAVIREHKEIRLVIVGEGNSEAELKAMTTELKVAEHTDFKGYVGHDDLPALYGNADIFVLPSLWEGMSNTLLEAMASGLPVVVTDTGGTRELVRDNGIIIPKEDPQAISEAILKLIDNQGLRIGMGKRSREISLEFSWGKAAKQYLDYYEKCKRIV